LSILNGKNYEFDASIYARRLRAVRTKVFKYIWVSDGRDELYNLQLDPGERNNLIKSQTKKAKELKTILMGYSDSSEKTKDQAK
jgi:K+/H+ antiporter YhaU regulatory subunit KhtT